MKAWELQAKEGFDALTLGSRDARELGPNEARVRVRAASLNFRDLIVARGAIKRKAPIIPASDGAGEVVAVGSNVTRLSVGDKVAGAFFPTWQSGDLNDGHHAKALGGGQDGMLAEEVILAEDGWVKMPNHLSFEQAATLPCAAVTAYNALFETAALRPGDTALVQGTGGVSLFALQLAKAAGARVVLTSKSAEKRERARGLGADHVIDYVANPTWGKEARAFTGGRGVDVVVEVGGPGTFDQSTAALRYGGALSLIGVLTGNAGPVNTYAIIHRALRVAGIYVGSVATFEALNRALEASSLVPIIDKVFDFDQAKEAYAHLASGDHFGKVVIRV